MFHGEGEFRVLHCHLGPEPPASVFLYVCLFSPGMAHCFAEITYAFFNVELVIVKYPNQIIRILNKWHNIYFVHKSLDL